MHMTIVSILVAAVLWSVTCSYADDGKTAPNPGVIATSADAAQPLGVGSEVPDINVRTVDGSNVALHTLLSERPTVLVFYRGGWCPYCNTHLGKLKEIEPELIDLGYQILAISPDRPEKLRESVKNEKLSYTLLSDSKLDATKAFGLAFKLDAPTLEKYKDYGINLKEASGESHNALPIPAVFLVDTEGTIRFQYANADYSVRLDNKELMAAAQAKKGASILGHKAKSINGAEVDLASYKDKVLLIVNVASECGLTPQYDQLQAIYREYATKGLEILAFPANNFGQQEPGTNKEIKAFCSTKFNVTFDMFSKISVKGEDIDPLYKDLTSNKSNGTFAGDIKWNFTKFLVNREGRVVARFEPVTKPDAEHVRKAIEGLL